ncbi:hypothetical protein [Microbacterium testaceum]|uniref:hypothetical protein n=1 Tax=Microbacterium testaceum TaxID=2033 RepID=UPI001D17C07A|nr:hypothetical protein [Microbacterium testaceum]MCC4248420.1 hypothetical protein [Microbacterium testaceum]
MVRSLLSRMHAAPARRSTFVPLAGRTALPALPSLVVAAAITVSLGAAGVVVPLVL